MSKSKETELTSKIKELRFKLGLTQGSSLFKVGVTFSTVNRWESARGNPSPLAKQRLEELMQSHDTIQRT